VVNGGKGAKARGCGESVDATKEDLATSGHIARLTVHDSGEISHESEGLFAPLRLER